MRNHPLAQEEIIDTGTKLVCKSASTMSFSGGQLHATAPNNSGLIRFSFDFRTVHLDDLRLGKGARNVDSAATGSTVGDHLRASDFSPLPSEFATLLLEKRIEQSTLA
jgi:hypothetical protein